MRLPGMSLKWKIFGGCFWLSIAILSFNAAYNHHLMKRSQRAGSHELKSAYRRLEMFQRARAQGMGAAVDAWASSPRLQEIFAKGDEADCRKVLQGIEETLAKTIQPDFVLVVDRHGDILRSSKSPIDTAEAKGMRLFADLRQGMSVDNGLVEHAHHVYLVAGEPVVKDHEVVGAVLIGRDLDKLLAEFAAQSDDEASKQIDVALVHNQQMTASSLPREQWEDVARASRLEAREVIEEGGQKTSVMTLQTGRHDFFSAQLNGYDGASTGSIGSLFLLRNRVEKEAHLRSLIADNLIVGVAALLISGIVSFILSVFVSRPINAFIAATNDLSAGGGDLTKRLELRSTATEMIVLEDNLNKMFAHLHKLASEVQAASFQVGASSAQISAASKQMLSGVADQTTKIESSTAAVTELSSSIQQVAENAMSATQVAKTSGELLEGGIAQLAETRLVIDETAHKIQALGQSGKRIGNIVEVIRQISEQTSLLALNASIEAARGGEAGRGFAVVAAEVKELATQTGKATEEVAGQIRAIQETTSASVEALRSIASQIAQLEATSVSIAAAVDQQSVAGQDLARSIDLAARNTEDVSSNIGQLRETSLATGAAASQVLTSSTELEQQASVLKSQVQEFLGHVRVA